MKLFGLILFFGGSVIMALRKMWGGWSRALDYLESPESDGSANRQELMVVLIGIGIMGIGFLIFWYG